MVVRLINTVPLKPGVTLLHVLFLLTQLTTKLLCEGYVSKSVSD